MWTRVNKIPLPLALMAGGMFLQLHAQTVFSFEGEAQGTTYHISYVAQEVDPHLPKAVDSLLAAFDQSVSTYQPNSIISKVNRNEATALDAWFVHCFEAGKALWKATDGHFDPTVYPLSNIWGFGPNKKADVPAQKIDSILPFVGMDKIELRQGQIVKKDPRVALDFNAFAQGYSADVVADFLRQKGCKAYLVEIGGEVYARGKKPNGDKWSIGIEKPRDNPNSKNDHQFVIELKNKGVATSGNYRKFRIIDGVKYAHHLDPRTGYPARNTLLSATVIADNTLTADATATGLLVMGLIKAVQYIENHTEIKAILMFGQPDGTTGVYFSPGVKELLKKE